jgi:phospholipase/carboxylesterase
MMETALFLGAELANAQVICVFVHGRTQTPEDMQGHVIRHLNTAGVAYALPRQPTKSWYDAKAVEALTDGTRAQLTASLDELEALIASLQARSGAPILLGGFSQSACLSLEHVFRGGKVDALAALTGCRVGTPACIRPDAPLDNLPTYLTGSDNDPWIPTTAFAQTFGALSLARAHLRAESFPGRAHEVSAAEITVLDQMLMALVDK